MIEIKELNFAIGENPILEDINLCIQDQEFVAIIGPNGAGKSTLIKLILGLLPMQKGEILIDGIPHHQWLKTRPVGYLPQREEFDRRFPATALDIVLMGLAGDIPLGKRCGAKHKKQALEALAFTGTADLAKRLIGTLSGGEFQRVLLARAIVSRSNYLILDEPEASIDHTGVETFFALLRDINRQGKTVITISHDLHTLSEYCSFLVCLNRHLHCHTKTELVNSELIHKTFGKAVKIIEKNY
ncbi:MAG: metal ABC transporter ATP-binding protein [Candidatus Cloacimonadaceae bacterium]|nr:metal ABC transporter ATP-binding protein [Candidatus Cloacimonadaceae bacterium]